MLIRGCIRLITIIGIFLICVLVGTRLHDKKVISLSFGRHPSDWTKNAISVTGNALSVFSGDQPQSSQEDHVKLPEDHVKLPQEDQVQESQRSRQSQIPISYDVGNEYREIFSVSTPDRKYFKIKLGDDDEAINPNIIPHPHEHDVWFIIAQEQRSTVSKTVWLAELVCKAKFKEDGTLQCLKAPQILPIASTYGDKCGGELAFFQMNNGPHDARVFWGPKVPYVIYGSNSMFTCFGMFMQDFRALVDWGFEPFAVEQFRKQTELQRPLPYGSVEKNWFVFWDKFGNIYAHYDIYPTRVFSKLEYDGSAGPDLAPLTADHDAQCIATHMPSIIPETESIHEATNSLSITLCKRADTSCQPDDTNTFIFTIIHHKKWYHLHAVYEPYVVLFQQTAPFALHGISTKPLWIHGRGGPGEWEKNGLKPTGAQADQTQMFFVTAISWKTHGQKYHGFIDDELFLTFGIEDADTGGIDVVAGDILADLGLCSSPVGI